MKKNLEIPLEIHRRLKTLALRRGVFLKVLVVELLNLGMAEIKRTEREQANATGK